MVDFAGFLVVAILLSVVGKVITGIVFADLPRKSSATGWRWLFYRTLRLHPVAAGGLIGLTELLPTPEFMGAHGGPWWYAVAGAMSNFVYLAAKRFVARKGEEL